MFGGSGTDCWGDSVSAETSSLIEGLFGVPKPSSAAVLHPSKTSQRNTEKRVQEKSRKRQRKGVAESSPSGKSAKRKKEALPSSSDDYSTSNADESAVEKAAVDHEDESDAHELQAGDTKTTQNRLSKKKKADAPVSYLEKAEKRLKGSRFRQLNEKLYTCTGQEAMEFFREEPEAFAEYHEGYREQTTSWPKKPMLQIADWLKRQPKNWIVADMGCGEAELSTLVPQKCHSFDLQALNDRVTVCEMSSVPLRDSSANVVVFCLSLMGTNVVEYLCEAWRILRTSGVLKIAEVGSRFENLKQFIRKTERLGFRLRNRQQQQFEGNFFVLLDFDKVQETVAVGDLPEIRLKPCLYKRR